MSSRKRYAVITPYASMSANDPKATYTPPGLPRRGAYSSRSKIILAFNDVVLNVWRGRAKEDAIPRSTSVSMTRICIVSGCDARYFSFLKGLLASLEPIKADKVVLDFGLSREQLQ